MSLFGGASTTDTKPVGSLFGNSLTAQPQQSSLFGNTTASSAPSTSLFSNIATAKPSLFGNATTTTSQAPATSLFGGTAAQPAQKAAGTGFGLFGDKSTTQPSNCTLFGGSTANNPNVQPGQNLFGGAANAQNQQQQQQQGLAAPPPDLTQSMMDSRRIWNEEDGAPRSRTVIEQLQMVNKKWDPTHPQHAMQTYLYNQVDPDAAPFYRPSPGENEEAWEDALRKAPSAGSIPFRVRGFYELGMRIVSQQRHLEILSGRLHEINEGLSALLRRHELDITSRAAAARRRHAALSQRVLTLATKTMVARNKGYQLEPAEETLRKRLGELERAVTDPTIAGREEEIWARMVQVREQGRVLEAELERTGFRQNGEKQEISDEVVKQAEKILKDYDKQLEHLTQELGRIKKDWEEWENTKTAPADGARR